MLCNFLIEAIKFIFLIKYVLGSFSQTQLVALLTGEVINGFGFKKPICG
jgi:hypothetical protein